MKNSYRAICGLILAAGLSLSTANLAWADEPTADTVTKAIDTFKTKKSDIKPTDRAALGKLADEVLKDVNFDTLSLAEIKRLQADAGPLSRAGLPTRGRVVARLVKLAESPDADGARAALLALSMANFVPPPQQDRVAGLALNHPKLKEAIAEPDGLSGIATLTRLEEEVQTKYKAQLLGLHSVLPDKVEPNQAGLLSMMVSNLANQTTPAEREPLRAKVSKLVSDAAASLPDDNALKTRLTDASKMLDGAFIKTGLVGQPAPDIEFTWTSPKFGEARVSKLSDLKGKVVVVDFWATWCGPCIASFPKVRQVQKHFEGYPVVILGVTSLQGAHFNQKVTDPAQRKTDTKGNPELEYKLMGEFIEQMEMTWPVAFGTPNVFNPEYGVNGIPHVVLIDPKGIVRERGLNPLVGTVEEKIEKITALLKEAGLPAPAAPKPAEAKPAAPAENKPATGKGG